MITFPPFKRGDTWSLTATFTKNKTGVDLTGTTIKSQIRKPDKSLVADLDVAYADQAKFPGVFVLTPVDPSTKDWPLDRLICDIVFSANGRVISTETFTIPVVTEVTQ